ncbi:glutamate--tRNA ligase [Ginsengibacter hankyongi]|uniref:Glutamate--tRNA ligase n=1 Tax=Ginsengibacter hankyongi TaxID=2607284 RepID=A0A5J5IQB8_9BACT|nr:glutamate--tRNA ligase [Ginsengibacter hankyongi]KAA9041752.1 glutamate--tRNA ligase [Ginsengibacter hankyongi]
MKKVRVRFAPSPTGGLHLGGVRTALYNYLFAKKHNGDFVLRVEDTDQNRYVEGAEQYIIDCLTWCGILPDEGPHHEGEYGPYRQSERKDVYRKYAEELVKKGHAYYAFDTPEEIESLREKLKSEGKSNLQYGYHVRNDMRNSLTLPAEETEALLKINFPHVIRIKIEANEFVSFRDMIRGDIQMDTSSVDDKVLIKADGMPTYHLAVVVDDYLMKITHAFRGEEWLPSAPVHVLLWKYLGLQHHMPEWAHFPLILKPDGNGKLSKRDGERLGFPVFAMQWKDPNTGDLLKGFKELGFLPEAFINLLAVLGWNDGTEQEIFTIDELIEKFSIERVHSSGAKFDFEKAKWFNHEWIKKLPVTNYQSSVKKLLQESSVTIDDENKLEKILQLVKDRCTLLTDFVLQSSFFFKFPDTIDITAVKPKWDDKKNQFFVELIRAYEFMNQWQHDELEKEFKEIAAANQIKSGELMLPLRIMLVGGKFGPGVFHIAELLEKEETIKRIEHGLSLLIKNHKVAL